MNKDRQILGPLQFGPRSNRARWVQQLCMPDQPLENQPQRSDRLLRRLNFPVPPEVVVDDPGGPNLRPKLQRDRGLDYAHGANELIKRRLIDKIAPSPCQTIGRSGPRALAALWEAGLLQLSELARTAPRGPYATCIPVSLHAKLIRSAIAQLIVDFGDPLGQSLAVDKRSPAHDGPFEPQKVEAQEAKPSERARAEAQQLSTNNACSSGSSREPAKKQLRVEKT